MPKKEILFWTAMLLVTLALMVWQNRPWDPEVRAFRYVSEGAAALSGKDLNEANRLFQLATRIHDSAAQEVLIGSLYQASGRGDKALQYARRSIRIRPTTGAYTLMGEIYQSADNEREMRRAYEMAVMLNPENTAVWNNLGYYYAERGENLDEALGLTSRAVQAEPNNGSFVDSLGWVCYRKGDMRQALGFLGRAVQLEPNVAEIRYHLGMAYLRADKPGAAEVEFRKALMIQPQFPAAREQLKTIANRRSF